MIHVFARRLETLLKSKQWNIGVKYGPEPFERPPSETVIVVDRDGSQDSFAPNRTHGSGMTARYVATRLIGATIRILAKSSKNGATQWDHEQLTEDLIDAVFCATMRWTNEPTGTDDHPRVAPVSFGVGRIVPKSELSGVYERFPGVIYDLPITLQRGVADVNASGLGYSFATIAAADTTVEVNDIETNTHVIATLPAP